jgi:hypothetical protein
VDDGESGEAWTTTGEVGWCVCDGNDVEIGADDDEVREVRER